jgi:outer membrane protein TolC
MLLLFFLSAFAAEPTVLATQLYESAQARYRTGSGSIEEIYRWSVRAMAGDQASKEAHRARMVALLELATRQVAAGMAPAEDVVAAQFYLAEAEEWLKK